MLSFDIIISLPLFNCKLNGCIFNHLFIFYINLYITDAKLRMYYIKFTKLIKKAARLCHAAFNIFNICLCK